MIDSLRVVLKDGRSLAVGQWNRKWVVGVTKPGERIVREAFDEKAEAVRKFMELAAMHGLKDEQQ